MSYTDLFQIDATVVANEFLDKYMPQANGDYVKVYLYLLKNRINGIDVETIAEQLQLTEGDVRRAIRYWEEQGIVSVGEASQEKEEEALAKPAMKQSAKSAQQESGDDSALSKAKEEAELRSHYKKAEGKEALDRLQEDSEFGELLFIVQKYRSKILNEREEQILAYLYDGLKLPVDVLDYLVSYCVEAGHNNMSYIEKTGLDWARRGIRDVRSARQRTKEFDAVREERNARKTAASSRQGMTRDTDLDAQLLDRIIQRKMV